MKKRILVIVLSNFNHDARVRRQVLALKDEYDTAVVCFGGEPGDGYELITIQPTKFTLFRKGIAGALLLLRAFTLAHRVLHNYHFIVKQLAGRRFDIIIANDVETLPIAFSFPQNPKIIFDAHEYAPRHFEDKKMWRIFFQNFNTWLCRKYIPLVAGMMTVGRGLANEYEKNFGRRPFLVTNASNYSNLSPSPMTSNKIRLVHHGIATPSRKLELMIDMMALLDQRFTLDLILLKPGFASRGTAGYIDWLGTRALSDTRIKILDPVSINQVVTTVNKYDMGVFLLPPINFNYENTLPNKLFDFIQARLGVAVGPTPEMAEIVRHYKNGVVSDDFTASSLAKNLNALDQQKIEGFKRNSAIAAAELNAEKNSLIILSLVRNVADT